MNLIMSASSASRRQTARILVFSFPSRGMGSSVCHTWVHSVSQPNSVSVGLLFDLFEFGVLTNGSIFAD